MDEARKTLAEMAMQALEIEVKAGSGISCPTCGCRDLRVYRSSQGHAVMVRYKQCRHCGRKILTSTESVETILRDVEKRG
jgi:DNA-directed RNA polymerase subunit RPC12/RpoP